MSSETSVEEQVENAVVESKDASESKDPSENKDGSEANSAPVDIAKDGGLAGAVAEHYNAVQSQGIEKRKDSEIYFLRNMNNWVKSMLINNALDILREDFKARGDESSESFKPRVLDLCCGKGGDLRKWEKARVNSVVLADIASVSVQEAQTRHEEMRQQYHRIFPAQFIVSDCASPEFKKDYYPFDLVSCQFSLHYSFESEERARQILVNATESLRPGGLFVGTLPDANRIVWAAREKGTKTAESKIEYSNRVVTVSFDDEAALANPPLFGAIFHFKLDQQVNMPEYLAYLPLLERLLLELDCSLVYAKPFNDFINENIEKKEEGRRDSEGRQLLNRMSALEEYPKSQEKGEQEYLQAKEFLSASAGHRSVGTLSQSEWEAACMYLVFIFKKN